MRGLPHLLTASACVAIAWASPALALGLAPLRTLDGPVANGQYGFATVVVGDMDGDGFAEYAVGASADSSGGPGAGRVFIYRGGPQHLGDPPAWVITGTTGELLGAALAPAGDLDGDGLADLLVGAPAGTTAAPTLPGRVLVLYGSTSLGSRPPVSLTGPVPGGRFGAAVAGLGDFDGDGLPDLAVGAPAANGAAGLVEVFHGGAPLSTSPELALHGRAAGDRFGSAVAGAGRTRGGALADLLVGAPYNSEGPIWSGRAYLYLGGAPPDTAPARSWGGLSAGDVFGSAVAGLGDVDSDGADDFAVGAPGAAVGALVEAGSAYLFLGAAAPPAAPTLTVPGTAAYGELGLAIAGVGDLDADGFADWAVAAPGSPDAGTAGDVRILLGRAAPSATPDTVLVGETTGDMFGRSVSNGGLVDAGRHALFLVGAWAHGTAGRAYLFGTADATAGVAPADAAGAAGLRLAAPVPNPAAGTATLALTLPHAGPVVATLHDVSGRCLRVIARGTLEAGRHALTVDASGLEPGLYLVRLVSGGGAATRKLVVAR